MKDAKMCGECKFHAHDDVDWYCDNENSEYYTAYTEYMDYCEDYEERSK